MRGEALQSFDAQMRHGPKEFSWFIYRVTNPDHARSVHGTQQQEPDAGGAAVVAGR